MTIALEQSVGVDEGFVDGGGADQITAEANVKAGSSLILGLRLGDTVTTVSSITDPRGGSWSELLTVDNPAGQRLSIWWAPRLTSAGPCTITANFNQAGASLRWMLHEFSGLADTTPDDVAENAGSGTSPSSGVVTPLTALTLLFAAAISTGDNTFTEDGTFTPLEEVARIATMFKVVTALDDADSTWTITSDDWAAGLVALQGTAEAAGKPWVE